MFSAADIKGPNFTDDDILGVGFDAEELKAADYTDIAELAGAGYTEERVYAAGYNDGLYEYFGYLV